MAVGGPEGAALAEYGTEEVTLEAEPLASRQTELTSLAEERGIDWRGQLEGLPTDDVGLMVGALGGLLGLGIQRVFDTETTLQDLERQSLRLEVEKEVLAQLAYGSSPLRSGYADPGASEEGRRAR